MKKCSKCQEFKNLESFPKNKTRKDGYASRCLICQRQSVNKHYFSNKDYYKNKSKKRCQELREWLKEYKSDLKCESCNEDHPACIEFHHKDPTEKEIEIADAVRMGYTKERLLQEISKCMVLCSNCHKKHHWNTRTGPYKNMSP